MRLGGIAARRGWTNGSGHRHAHGRETHRRALHHLLGGEQVPLPIVLAHLVHDIFEQRLAVDGQAESRGDVRELLHRREHLVGIRASRRSSTHLQLELAQEGLAFEQRDVGPGAADFLPVLLRDELDAHVGHVIEDVVDQLVEQTATEIHLHAHLLVRHRSGRGEIANRRSGGVAADAAHHLQFDARLIATVEIGVER